MDGKQCSHIIEIRRYPLEEKSQNWGPQSSHRCARTVRKLIISRHVSMRDKIHWSVCSSWRQWYPRLPSVNIVLHDVLGVHTEPSLPCLKRAFHVAHIPSVVKSGKRFGQQYRRLGYKESTFILWLSLRNTGIVCCPCYLRNMHLLLFSVVIAIVAAMATYSDIIGVKRAFESAHVRRTLP